MSDLTSRGTPAVTDEVLTTESRQYTRYIVCRRNTVSSASPKAEKRQFHHLTDLRKFNSLPRGLTKSHKFSRLLPNIPLPTAGMTKHGTTKTTIERTRPSCDS